MNNSILPHTFRTERLLLRQWCFKDKNAVLGYASDEEWARYMPVPQPYLSKHAVEFIARQVLLDPAAHCAYAIIFENQAVGGINIRFFFERYAASIGYSIARPVWGKGLTPEAARIIIDAAFSTHDDLNRIESMTDNRNLASLRVMEKLGMRREGVLRQSRFEKGELIDVVCCSLLRSEWAAGCR